MATEAWSIASNANTWGVKVGTMHAIYWRDAPHTGLRTCNVHRRQFCVDGPAARMCLERLWSATSATEVTGHGGRRKMGGRARTGLWWTLVNGDLAASGGSRTSTTEAAIFTFHWAVVTAA